MADRGRGGPSEEWIAAVRDRLARRIEARGLSHRKLAALVDRSGASISLRLTRSSLGEWWALYRISEALGLTPDQVLGFIPMPVEPADVRGARVGRRLDQIENLVQKAREDIEPRKR